MTDPKDPSENEFERDQANLPDDVHHLESGPAGPVSLLRKDDPDAEPVSEDEESEDEDEQDEDEDGESGTSGKKGGGGKKIGKKRDFEDVLILHDEDFEKDPDEGIVDKLRMALLSPFDLSVAGNEDFNFKDTMAHKLRGLDDGLHRNHVEKIDLVNREAQQKAQAALAAQQQQGSSSSSKTGAMAAAIAAVAVIGEKVANDGKAATAAHRQEMKADQKAERKQEDQKATEKHEQERPIVQTKEEDLQAKTRLDVVQQQPKPQEQTAGVGGMYMTYAMADIMLDTGMPGGDSKTPTSSSGGATALTAAPPPAQQAGQVDMSNYPPPNYSIRGDFNTASANMSQLMQGITARMENPMAMQATAPTAPAADIGLQQKPPSFDAPMKI